MKLIGSISMVIGAVFGILHVMNGNIFGSVTATIAFISGLVTVLSSRR